MTRIEEMKRMREVVEALERERKRSMDGETTHGQTHDDMWMNMFFMRHALRHLEPCGACEQGWNVCKYARKYAV